MATLNQMVREFEAVLSGAADNAAAISRINAVRRVYADLYDARDEDGHLRELESFEALFIASFDRITREANKERADALRTWGDGAAYQAICSLSYRTTAKKLEDALAVYERLKEASYSDELDAVAGAMSEAAE